MLAVAAVLVALTLYVVWTARRLDRLHARVDTAGLALQAQLSRRLSVAVVFAAIAQLEPVAAGQLAVAARSVDQAMGLTHEREISETAVTRALVACFSAPLNQPSVPPAAAVEMHDESLRVSLARRFYNDTVRDVLVVRERRVVRWGRLAGHAPVPSYFEMDDDELPLARISVASGPTIES